MTSDVERAANDIEGEKSLTPTPTANIDTGHDGGPAGDTEISVPAPLSDARLTIFAISQLVLWASTVR